MLLTPAAVSLNGHQLTRQHEAISGKQTQAYTHSIDITDQDKVFHAATWEALSSQVLRERRLWSQGFIWRCNLCRAVRYEAVTWPRLAAAMGFSWKLVNRRCTGAPNSASMMAMALAGAKAGTLSCNLESSSVKAAGKRSEREENSCPTLMNVGPRDSRDSLQGKGAASRALQDKYLHQKQVHD